MGENKLIIIRGLSGSGKSTKSLEIQTQLGEKGYHTYIFSTDDFWGKDYQFVAKLIRDAHNWNQKRAFITIKYANDICALDPTQKYAIIIDNTNSTGWEAKPYVQEALKHKWEVQIVEPSTPWAFDAEECFKKSRHGVPLETLKAMLERWEYNLTVDQIVESCAPWEKKK